jgi:hypothetical protein
MAARRSRDRFRRCSGISVTAERIGARVTFSGNQDIDV